MAQKFFQSNKNSKPRVLALLVGMLIILITLSLLFMKREQNPLKESISSKIPAISAIPGNVTSEKYRSLQEEDNRRRAAAAQKTGGSAIATIIGTHNKDPLDNSQSLGIENPLSPCPHCACANNNAEEVPGLNNICPTNPDLALSQAEHNKAMALKLLSDCPSLAQAFALRNPALFKELLLEHPSLAKRLSTLNPELIKQFIASDPAFAKQFALNNPEALKTLLKNDPDFVEQFAKIHPDILKDLLSHDPEFTKAISQNNPALIKKMMLQDPAFAKQFALNNPEALKNLLKNDPDFATAFTQQFPSLLKTLLKNDPAFSYEMAQNHPELMKQLLLDDPEFARAMAAANPQLIRDLMEQDPDFKKKLHAQVPGLQAALESSPLQSIEDQFAHFYPGWLKSLLKSDLAFANDMVQKKPDRVQKILLSDPPFALAMAGSNPQPIRDLMNRYPDFNKQLLAQVPGIQAALDQAPLPTLDSSKLAQTDAQRALSIEALRGKQQDVRAQAARQIQLNEQQKNQIETLSSAMEKNAKDVLKNLEAFNTQAFVQGEAAKDITADGIGGTKPGSDGSSSGTSSHSVLIKAGTILYASLDTAVNSDEPGPVMGTVIDGPYKGSKVIGTLQMANTGVSAEKVVLNFTTLTIPDRPKSLKVSAVAVDPDSARTAMASDVNHHYLLRYGTLLGSAFIAGYGKAITAQGSTQVSAPTGSIMTQSTPLDNKQLLYAALGQVGQNVSQEASNYFNTPNTIKVDQGTGFGLLILSDVSDS